MLDVHDKENNAPKGVLTAACVQKCLHEMLTESKHKPRPGKGRPALHSNVTPMLQWRTHSQAHTRRFNRQTAAQY